MVPLPGFGFGRVHLAALRNASWPCTAAMLRLVIGQLMGDRADLGRRCVELAALLVRAAGARIVQLRLLLRESSVVQRSLDFRWRRNARRRRASSANTRAKRERSRGHVIGCVCPWRRTSRLGFGERLQLGRDLADALVAGDARLDAHDRERERHQRKADVVTAPVLRSDPAALAVGGFVELRHVAVERARRSCARALGALRRRSR